MPKLRLDNALVNLSLAESRNKAQAYIMAGEVLVNGQVETRADRTIKEEDIIANTYACPLQKVKTYNPNEIIDHKNFIREKETKEKFSGWYNKLIF